MGGGGGHTSQGSYRIFSKYTHSYFEGGWGGGGAHMAQLQHWQVPTGIIIQTAAEIHLFIPGREWGAQQVQVGFL